MISNDFEAQDSCGNRKFHALMDTEATENRARPLM